MKIGLIGPANIKRVCDAVDIGEEEYYSIVRAIAEKVAKAEHEILIIPAKRSGVEFFAEVYRDEDGPKIIGIMPETDDEKSLLNKQACDEIINCSSACEMNLTMLKNCDMIICIGYGPESIAIICSTKVVQFEKVYVIKELISKKLPDELETCLRINYVKADDVKGLLK